jgi:hypothetical protein
MPIDIVHSRLTTAKSVCGSVREDFRAIFLNAG